MKNVPSSLFTLFMQKGALISHVTYLAQIKCCDKNNTMKYCHVTLSQRTLLFFSSTRFKLNLFFDESQFSKSDSYKH